MAKLALTDIAAGFVLVATINANNALIEAALENTLSRDGTTPNTMSAALDMNSQNINNLPDATANQSPVTLAQLNAASISAIATISDLSDVDTTGVVANDLLFFNGTNWVDTAAALTWNGSTLAVTGALTATTIGGITSGNLVDKSAIEIVSGLWDFTAGFTLDGTNGLKAVTGQSGTVQTFGPGTNGETGYSIDGKYSIFTNSIGGFVTMFDDVNNHILWKVFPGPSANSRFEAYAGNALKFTTLSTGAKVTGNLEATQHGGIIEDRLVDKMAAETITGAWIFTGAGAITATSYGGITEANLLDKSATETITGAYTFTGGITLTSGDIVAGTINADFAALTATTYGGILEGNLVNLSAAELITGLWDFSAKIDFFGGLNVYNAGQTDFMSMTHDGIDFNWAGTNTIDWNITGITAIQAGTVDADFDAITGTSYGGVIEASLVDKTANEVVSGDWSVPSHINTQDASYTLVLGDAGKTIRKTSTTVSQVYTIPDNASVAYDIGTLIAIQNDGSVAMSVAITTDTLTSSSGLGTGTRTLASGGAAVIQKVASTSWKITGDQLT